MLEALTLSRRVVWGVAIVALLPIIVHTDGMLRVGGGGLAIGCHVAVLDCDMMMRRGIGIVGRLRGCNCVAVIIRGDLVEVVMVAEGGCHGWVDMERASYVPDYFSHGRLALLEMSVRSAHIAAVPRI
jgi:hypothetical protein